VPSLAGFTPVENKSMELSLLSKKVDEEVPAIQKPVFIEPINQKDRRRNHHGSNTEVGGIPEQRRSAPESFLFPGSFTIPLSFAITNKPPYSDGDEFGSVKDFMADKKLPEYPWEARNREIREMEDIAKEKRIEKEEKPPEPPAHRMENRPKAKT
jgi:hypothetical protein